MNLNLRDINLIVFPDWHQSEDSIYQTLTLILKWFICNPANQIISLVIDTSNGSKEEAELVISDIIMNLHLAENIYIPDNIGICILDKLTQQEWEILRLKMSARLVTNIENQQVIRELDLSHLSVCQLDEFGKDLLLLSLIQDPDQEQIDKYLYLTVLGENSTNEWIRKSATIPGWLFPGEHEFLWELAIRKCEGHILEIGTWMGKSACILAGACIENFPNTKVICVDPFDMQGTSWQEKFHKKLLPSHTISTFENFINNANRLGFIDYIVPISTTSEQSLEIIDCKLRMAFIDGQHDYEHVKQDTELIIPKLVSGGVLALHDSSGDWPGVTKYINENLKINNNLVFLENVGTITAFEKL